MALVPYKSKVIFGVVFSRAFLAITHWETIASCNSGSSRESVQERIISPQRSSESLQFFSVQFVKPMLIGLQVFSHVLLYLTLLILDLCLQSYLLRRLRKQMKAKAVLWEYPSVVEFAKGACSLEAREPDNSSMTLATA